MSKERLDFIRDYYSKQNNIVVELPPHTTTQHNGIQVIHRFNAERMGYRFVNGRATVKREDVPKLQAIYPRLIIHDKDVK